MQEPNISNVPEYITIDETVTPTVIKVQLTGRNVEDAKRLKVVQALKRQVRSAVKTEWVQPERVTEETPVAPRGNVIPLFPTTMDRESFTQWTQDVTSTLPKEYRVAEPRKAVKRTCHYCRCEIDDLTHGFLVNPESGKPVPCPACSPAIRRNIAGYRVRPYIQSLVEKFKFHNVNNLPREAELFCLEEYPGDEQARTYVEDFIGGELQELILIGPPGRGKSVLSMLAAKELRGLFLPMADYLSLLKENFSSKDSNHIKEISQNVEVLVIDDLARTSGSQFAIDEFGEMIDRRHAAGLRTLITTNYTFEGLARRWSTDEGKVTGVQPVEPIISRLRGWYTAYEMSGPDLRVQ